MKPKQIVEQLLEAESWDELDAEANAPENYIKHWVTQAAPVCFLTLIDAFEKNRIEVDGNVTRTNYHYVHERSTEFQLTGEHTGTDPDHEDDLDKALDEAEKLIEEEIVKINRKIYASLEREWDWQSSDEVVDENISANEYTFEPDGTRADVEDSPDAIPFDQLEHYGKEIARDWWKKHLHNENWYDWTIEGWIKELEDMGFTHADIAFSGFWSQGDGASFTAKHFNLKQWVDWFYYSSKPKEAGHPYTDDLNPS